jgi:hypothetical protein
MSLDNTYTDSYLKNLVSESIESSALEDVNAINADFPEPWKTKLVVIRTYILTCGENCKSADDLFHTKSKFYEGEWKMMLKLATDVFNALNNPTSSMSYMSIPLERS